MPRRDATRTLTRGGSAGAGGAGDVQTNLVAQELLTAGKISVENLAQLSPQPLTAYSEPATAEALTASLPRLNVVGETESYISPAKAGPAQRVPPLACLGARKAPLPPALMLRATAAAARCHRVRRASGRAAAEPTRSHYGVV